MTDSAHTLPPREYAARNFPRDGNGDPILPPVRRRKPRPGDVHPLEAGTLRRFLPTVPLEYIYGLERIELRPRKGEIGKPLGFYAPREKLVVLFSVPLVWEGMDLSSEVVEEFCSSGAERIDERPGVTLRWPDPVDLEVLFFWDVFLHELGHHYSHQWRRSRKKPPWGPKQEAIAELHRFKLTDRYRRKYRRG